MLYAFSFATKVLLLLLDSESVDHSKLVMEAFTNAYLRDRLHWRSNSLVDENGKRYLLPTIKAMVTFILVETNTLHQNVLPFV